MPATVVTATAIHNDREKPCMLCFLCFNQWCVSELFQVDLGSVALVVASAIQGRQDVNQWVTSYKLKYSKDGIRFYDYRSGRSAVRENTCIKHT